MAWFTAYLKRETGKKKKLIRNHSVSVDTGMLKKNTIHGMVWGLSEKGNPEKEKTH